MSDEIHKDTRYSEAVKIVCSTGKTTISHLQRVMRIGYNHAAHLFERMENDGIVSGVDMLGTRKLLKTNSDNEREHTEHCKKRQRWSDGECECEAKKIAKG